MVCYSMTLLYDNLLVLYTTTFMHQSKLWHSMTTSYVDTSHTYDDVW